MAVHARDWMELHELMRTSVGDAAADKLMDFLPPVGWADVATRQDLEHLRIATKADIAELRAEFRGEFSELKGEFSELKGEFSELKGEFSELKGEFSKLETKVDGLAGHIDGIDGSIRHTVEMFAAEIRVDFQRQINRLIYVMVPALFTSIGLSAGVAAAISR